MIPSKFKDSRGYFMETFRHSHLDSFVVKQENTSMSLVKGTLRGIHIQLNSHSQAHGMDWISLLANNCAYPAISTDTYGLQNLWSWLGFS